MWIPASQFPWQHYPDFYAQWLQNPASLTQRFRDLANENLTHQLIFEGWQGFTPDLLEPLMLSSYNTVWTREIVFYGHDQAWEWAKTIIPKDSLVDEGEIFLQLGNKPIGDILFSDPTLRRSEFAIARLDQQHPYTQKAGQCLNAVFAEIWARRSVFYFYQKPILIVELFLPAFWSEVALA